MRRAGGAANGSEGAGASGKLAAPESLARRRTRSVRPEGPRVVVAAALAPLERRAVVGEGPPPPPAETSSRLEMVLLCPFGMSHVWAREV